MAEILSLVGPALTKRLRCFLVVVNQNRFLHARWRHLAELSLASSVWTAGRARGLLGGIIGFLLPLKIFPMVSGWVFWLVV